MRLIQSSRGESARRNSYKDWRGRARLAYLAIPFAFFFLAAILH